MSEILIQNVSKTYSTKDGNVQALKNVNLLKEKNLVVFLRKNLESKEKISE